MNWFTDYERYGVPEYWLFDPQRDELHLYRHDAGRYVEVTPPSDAFESAAVPGFVLDLAAVRRSFLAL